jgi:hypothetical protein
MNRLRIATLISALGLVGATPVVAAATAPADKQYGNPITQTTSGGDVAGQGNQAGTVQGTDLPFTGFDAGLIVVGGLTLVGLGLGLRRVSRRSSH